jgi:hypothetical protein
MTQRKNWINQPENPRVTKAHRRLGIGGTTMSPELTALALRDQAALAEIKMAPKLQAALIKLRDAGAAVHAIPPHGQARTKAQRQAAANSRGLYTERGNAIDALCALLRRAA